jgi:type II secretory pathway pseudopilin PulG
MPMEIFLRKREIIAKLSDFAGNAGFCPHYSGKGGRGSRVSRSFAIIPRVFFHQAEGFSLMEVMIAVFILTFGLLSAAQLLTMTMGLEVLARSKSTAVLAAQNELDRLADLYRRNPEAEELMIGVHEAAELTEIRNPLTQKALNRYKIMWFVDGIPDSRPEINLPGRTISVRAIPMLTENVENPDVFRNKVITINAIITTEPQ